MFFSFDVLSAAQGHLRTKNKFKTLFWWPLVVVVVAFSLTGEEFDYSFPACAFQYFFKWRSALTFQFHFFLISPQWLSEFSGLWTSVPWRVACKLVSLISSHTYSWTAFSANSDLVGSVVDACSGVTCHLHFLQTDRGLLRASAVIRHRIRVSTQS